MRKLRSRAFTFVEILIVVSLFSVLAIALYQSLSNGLKIWQRAYKEVPEEDVMIFFDKLTTDLRNTFFHSEIRFVGSQSGLIFITTMKVPGDGVFASKDEYVKQIGVVNYYYDKQRQAICRKQADYGQAIFRQFSGERVMVEHVKSMKISYYTPDDVAVKWKEKVENAIPPSVKIELEFGDVKNLRKMSRIINIPTGGEA